MKNTSTVGGVSVITSPECCAGGAQVGYSCGAMAGSLRVESKQAEELKVRTGERASIDFEVANLTASPLIVSTDVQVNPSEPAIDWIRRAGENPFSLPPSGGTARAVTVDIEPPRDLIPLTWWS